MTPTSANASPAIQPDVAHYGWYVMGRYTSVAWYSTEEQAREECARMNQRGGTYYYVEFGGPKP